MSRAGYTTEELVVLEQLYAEQRRELIKQETQPFRDFKDAILTGSDSGMSVAGRYDIARSKFAALESKLAGGGRVDAEEFQKLGGDLFDLSKQMFGSTTDVFMSDRSRLLGASDRAISNIEAITPEEQLRAAVDKAGAETVGQLTTANFYLQQISAALQGGTGGGNGLQQDNMQNVEAF